MDTEVDRILTLLRNKIRERGFTQLDVQEKLRWGRSYISQLLTQQKSLRVEQVLMILGTIDIEPREFYAELYQFPRPEVRVRNLDDYAAPQVDGDGAAAADRQSPEEPSQEAVELSDDFYRNYRELRAMVRALVQLLVERDIVSIEEVADKARAADPDSDLFG